MKFKGILKVHQRKGPKNDAVFIPAGLRNGDCREAGYKVVSLEMSEVVFRKDIEAITIYAAFTRSVLATPCE